MTKPKRGTFDIATHGKGRETETGYVLGGFAARAPRKGEYFWQFTHLETGTKVNVYPPHESKASALEHLAKLEDGSAPQCAALEQTFARYGRAWGLGQ